jgi:hypothetical protein
MRARIVQSGRERRNRRRARIQAKVEGRPAALWPTCRRPDVHEHDIAESAAAFPPVATVSAVSCRSVVGGQFNRVGR